jgi:uncharacterized protein YcfL
MRHLALASLAVLALAGCSSYDSNSSVPAPTGSAASSNPIDSSGRSDAVTSGSSSNTASGSTVTRSASPGAVR